MVHENRCTGTTTNDGETEIDNCGADRCEVVEGEKKMTSFYFIKKYMHTGCIKKKAHVPSMEMTVIEPSAKPTRARLLGTNQRSRARLTRGDPASIARQENAAFLLSDLYGATMLLAIRECNVIYILTSSLRFLFAHTHGSRL
jgi:hypothetical protein